jgi:hypothetical protein
MSDPTAPPPNLVRPARPHQDPEACWELTGIDRANHFLVLRGTWLFDGGLVAERLRESLAELLCFYPHLAGRMREGARVVLDGSGVPFTHTELPQLSLGMLEEDHALARLLHPKWRQGRVKKGFDAPLAVRLTELADGQALTLTCTHACMDGWSFYTLVRNWSRLHRGREIAPPVLDQSRLPAATERDKGTVIAAAREAGWAKPPLFRSFPTLAKLALGMLTNRSRPIPLDDAFLARLESAAGGGAIGRNDQLCAHLSRMCARLYGHGADTRCRQVVVLDGRRRVPSLSEAFVGNAAVSVIGASFPGDISLPALARATHEALGPWLVKPSEAMAEHLILARDLMRHTQFLMHFDITAMHCARPTISYINNFGRLPIYDVDFGCPEAPLTPRRVIPHDLPDPILLWPAPPVQGGLELYLTGAPCHAILELDPDHPWWADLRLEA